MSKKIKQPSQQVQVQYANLASQPAKMKTKKSSKPPKPGKAKKPKKPLTTGQKVLRVIIILVVIGLAVAVGVIYYLSQKKGEVADGGGRVEFPDPIYSTLTGEEIKDPRLNSSPTFCVQIPNGNDGGRPQAGLTQAAVVFEAIAEAGITRFAAVFQNANTSAIGPIRSLRPYYLDWDTPFGCTVVHAGGSDEALAALKRGGQRDLSENYDYMWRESSSGRRWNNLFTSSKNLIDFNLANGYNTSTIKAFPRTTPEEVEQILQLKNAENESSVDDSAEGVFASASQFEIDFGRATLFNTIYTYDSTTNKYLRAYENGEPHMVYDCAPELNRPETMRDCGNLVQVTPSVVIAMMVHQTTMSDNYHQNIRTIGSGEAVIFQNGMVIEGTWSKSSQSEQIVFKDANGEQVKLTPGQVWVAAVPQYGLVQW